MSDQSSSQNQNQNQNDEIDLSVVFDKIKSIFKSILIGIVMIFQFFWNHKIRLTILLIIGLVIQFFLNSSIEFSFLNHFYVRTNHGSTEYLYSKVSSINSKIEGRDDEYLKEVFGEHYSKVSEIEMAPVIDVYSLVNKSEENKEVFKLLLDQFGDLSFLKNEININEYPTHKIKIYTKGNEYGELISKRLYDYLESNSYYNKIKETALKSYHEQLEQNQKIRSQIDSIIKDQKSNKISRLDNNSINFTGSQDLKELLSQKQRLLNADLSLKNQLASEDKVLKVIDSSFGVLQQDQIRQAYSIPMILLSAYFFFFFLRFLSKKTMRFIKNSK